MAIGEKRVETRSWHTYHSGLVAICASKAFSGEERELSGEYPFEEAFERHGLKANALPLGCIVAVARLILAFKIERLSEVRNMESIIVGPCSFPIGRHEWYFGNYLPGRYGWLFTDITPLSDPIPYKGQQGLFNLDTKTSSFLQDIVRGSKEGVMRWD